MFLFTWSFKQWSVSFLTCKYRLLQLLQYLSAISSWYFKLLSHSRISVLSGSSRNNSSLFWAFNDLVSRNNSATFKFKSSIWFCREVSLYTMWTRCESRRDSISFLSSRIFPSYSFWFLISDFRSSAIQLCSHSSFLFTFNPQPFEHSAVWNLQVFKWDSRSRLLSSSWQPSLEHEVFT